ncbi:MAG: RNA 2',3'-cyclic phosphodiesterase [Candidatus Nanohaloarchaea archaeon]
MRIFSAVDIENEELLAELERVREKVDLGFNPVPKDKMHITLQFFEEVDQRQLEAIEKGLGTISTQPFAAEISGVGAFPSEDYIRVVWAGAEKQKLGELYQKVSESHQVPEDSGHDFHPHVTLARVKDVSSSKMRKLQRVLKEFSGHSFSTLEVDAVKLFESRLTGKGSEYRVIREVELG